MSRKYRKLTEHLAARDENEWTASFQDIEQVLGFSLPESARSYQAWWSNQMRSQSLGWQLAGWKATALDLPNESVKFIYVGGEEEDAEPTTDVEMPITSARLTIAEAKAGLAASFDVDPSQIEITIKA
jgi:hypothetical protein